MIAPRDMQNGQPCCWIFDAAFNWNFKDISERFHMSKWRLGKAFLFAVQSNTWGHQLMLESNIQWHEPFCENVSRLCMR